MCCDQMEALEDLIGCGVKRVLTSGGKQTAVEATKVLKALVEKAGNDIDVMPGSGVNETNVQSLMEQTGATNFHCSARSAG